MKKLIHSKRLALLHFILFFLVTQTSVLAQWDKPAKDPILPSDTVFKIDYEAPEEEVLENDPKVVFKEMPESSAAFPEGIYSSKLNPQVIGFVKNYKAKNNWAMEHLKVWGKPYLNLIDDIFIQHGVPKEMKYLAVIESGLKSNVVSSAGAVGPWAFMYETAKSYGLKIKNRNDERVDYFKSTHAAASMLSELFTKYGDWLLVIAAYNCGPGNVDKAIRRTGSTDFWTLQHALPKESMNHVKKFIATHYMMEGAGGITTSTKREAKEMMFSTTKILTEKEKNISRKQIITGRYNSMVITKYLSMDMDTFEKFNPGFDNHIAFTSYYELQLPGDKMDTFLAKKNDILNESLQLLLSSTRDAGSQISKN
jgi:membrane-bound lytic murein transglycosylase D